MNLTLHNHTYENVYLHWASYANNRPALIITSAQGEPLVKASVNMPEISNISPDYILIKDYAENEGILAWLIEHEVVIDTGTVIPSGFVKLNLCKIHPNQLPERALLG